MARGRKRSASTDHDQNPTNKEIEEMKNSLKEIGKLVQKLQDSSLTNEELLDSFCIWEKSNSKKMEIVDSWKNKRPDLMCPPYFQYSDDCWAIALSRAITILMKMIGSTYPYPTPYKLSTGVEAHLLTPTGGIYHLSSAIPYLTSAYVSRMTIRPRPSLDDEDQLETFEKCITRLLAKAPVAISFDILPSFQDFDGKGIYIPTAMDCQIRLSERLPRRRVLLTGNGVELQGGNAVEFWEAQDNFGVNWGDAGFIRFARHKGLIREVYELEV